jgi:hypothetical protein
MSLRYVPFVSLREMTLVPLKYAKQQYRTGAVWQYAACTSTLSMSALSVLISLSGLVELVKPWNDTDRSFCQLKVTPVDGDLSH